MVTRFATLALTATFLGCAAHHESPVPDYVPLAFAPDSSEAEAVVSKAVERLRVATGRDWIIDPYGIPVALVPEVIGSDDEPVCGGTILIARVGEPLVPERILISTDERLSCVSRDSVLIHESIHANDPKAQHLPAPSIFDEGAEERIDTTGLRLLCLVIGGCPAEKPEL